MIKKFFVQFVGEWNKRANTPHMVHEAAQKKLNERERELSDERHRQIMEGRGENKYVSERTTPTEEEITGPSDSKQA